MTIGERIKQRRKELGMTQDELAKKSGYKWRSSINKIELGEQSLPQLQIEKIAKALRVTPSYLAGWEDDTYTDFDGKERLHAENTAIMEEILELGYSMTKSNQELVVTLMQSILEKQKKELEEK